MAINRESFQIEEGEIRKGTIGSGTYLFVGGQWAYFEMGSEDFKILCEFATFYANTPHTRVREDLIQKDYELEFLMPQFECEKIGLIWGGKPRHEASIGKTIIPLGSNEHRDARPESAWQLKFRRVDGQYWYINFRVGKIVSTEAGINPDGSKHAVMKVIIHFYPDENMSDDTENVLWAECVADESSS